MQRTTDGQPARVDGSNLLILVSDMRTSRQDLRTAWLGVEAAIRKRDNIIQRANTEALRNIKVKNAINTNATESSVIEALIAGAQFADVQTDGVVSIHPGALIEAGLRPAQAMRQAAHDMAIEDANSEAVVRNLFYDMAEAQGEIDIVAQQYRSMLTQFNGVVGQTGHDVYQSKREHAYTTSLPANDPGYRLARDSHRLELATQLEIAARLAYLAARRAEYEYTARLSASNYRQRRAQVSGEYRETLWGYTNYPITVIGDLTLQRAGSDAIVPVAGVAAPNVGADTTATTQGAAVTINVLSNDSAANGGTLTILSVSKPQFGTATTDGKTVTYTPNADFNGTDTFSYVIGDGNGGISTGFVTVTVNGPGGPNQSPIAAADNVGTTPGTAITINVLSNDSDPNGDALMISIDGPPSHGTAVVQNGQIVYTPQTGFTGIDSLTYIVSDGRGGTATATVTLNVTATGQPLPSNTYLPQLGR